MTENFAFVVIGTSAGGVESLTAVVQNLPPDLNAAVFVVMHMPITARSVLPQILTRVQTIPATYPLDGQRIQPGRIYVAPPDWHMLIKDPEHISLVKGPRENGCRPAVDPLFRSAAVLASRPTIGVVLSGALDDGTAGLLAIKRAGGLAVVQDPKDTAFQGMPTSAIANVHVDYVLPAAEIGRLIGELVANPPPVQGMTSPDDRIEVKIDELQAPMEATQSLQGTVSGFSCPECGGTLWSIDDSQRTDIRFRCRVGHAYSSDALLDQQSDTLERALWTAIRALRERADLSKRLADRMDNNHHHSLARRHKLASNTANLEAQLLVDLLREGGLLRAEQRPPGTTDGEEVELGMEEPEDPGSDVPGEAETSSDPPQ